MSEPTALTLSDRFEIAVSGLSDLIQTAITNNAKDEQRTLILAQSLLIESLMRLDLDAGPHCAEIIAGAGIELDDLEAAHV